MWCVWEGGGVAAPLSWPGGGAGGGGGKLAGGEGGGTESRQGERGCGRGTARLANGKERSQHREPSGSPGNAKRDIAATHCTVLVILRQHNTVYCGDAIPRHVALLAMRKSWLGGRRGNT